MKLDRNTKGVFEVDFAPQTRRLRAQFFWPDQKPWPRGVSQTCIEGVIYDSYNVYIHEAHTSQVIHPGCLVLMERELDNIVGVLYKQQLDEEHYIVEQIQQEKGEQNVHQPESGN